MAEEQDKPEDPKQEALNALEAMAAGEDIAEQQPVPTVEGEPGDMEAQMAELAERGEKDALADGELALLAGQGDHCHPYLGQILALVAA